VLCSYLSLLIPVYGVSQRTNNMCKDTVIYLLRLVLLCTITIHFIGKVHVVLRLWWCGEIGLRQCSFDSMLTVYVCVRGCVGKVHIHT
jgi:hypothetical protein